MSTELKKIFANNLKRLMNINRKSRKDVCEALDFNYFTFTDWIKAKKYPRMDKVEKLADYFGVSISDLIEDRSRDQKNDAISDIISWLQESNELLEVLTELRRQTSERQILGINLLNTLINR